MYHVTTNFVIGSLNGVNHIIDHDTLGEVFQGSSELHNYISLTKASEDIVTSVFRGFKLDCVEAEYTQLLDEAVENCKNGTYDF